MIPAEPEMAKKASKKAAKSRPPTKKELKRMKAEEEFSRIKAEEAAEAARIEAEVHLVLEAVVRRVAEVPQLAERAATEGALEHIVTQLEAQHAVRVAAREWDRRAREAAAVMRVRLVARGLSVAAAELCRRFVADAAQETAVSGCVTDLLCDVQVHLVLGAVLGAVEAEHAAYAVLQAEVIEELSRELVHEMPLTPEDRETEALLEMLEQENALAEFERQRELEAAELRKEVEAEAMRKKATVARQAQLAQVRQKKSMAAQRAEAAAKQLAAEEAVEEARLKRLRLAKEEEARQKEEVRQSTVLPSVFQFPLTGPRVSEIPLSCQSQPAS